MNRLNVLEKHLLSKCHDSNERISNILDQRYSMNGEQKPCLYFNSNNGKITKKNSLFTENKDNNSVVNFKKKKINTRKDLKEYILSKRKKQKKVKKLIHKYKKLSTLNEEVINNLIEKNEIPKIEDFFNLHYLWQKYMNDLLFQNNSSLNTSNSLQKLASADYIGSFLTVKKSVNKNLVGIKGILIYETKYFFLLCVPRSKNGNELIFEKNDFFTNERVGGFKLIKKQGSFFSFDIINPIDKINDSEHTSSCFGFTLIGSMLQSRPVDRSNKKFKTHNIKNIF